MNSPGQNTTEVPQVSLSIFNNVSFWVADQVGDKDVITNNIRDHGGRVCDTLEDGLINMALVPKDITSDALDNILNRGITALSTEWVTQSVKDLTVLPTESYLVQRSQSVGPNLEGSREPDSHVEHHDGTASNAPGPPAPDVVLPSAEVDLDNISEISVALRLGSPLTAQTSVPPEPENAQALKELDSQQAEETLSEPENLNELSLDSPVDANGRRAYIEYAGSRRYYFTDTDRVAMRKYLENKDTRVGTTEMWNAFTQTPEGSHRSGAAWANYHHRHPSVSPPRIISEETVVEEADEQDLDDDLSSLSDIDLDDPLPSSASGTSPVKGDDAEVLIAALKKAPPGRIRPKFWKRLAARAPQHNHSGWNRVYYSNTAKYDTPAGRDLSHSQPLTSRNEFTAIRPHSAPKTAKLPTPGKTPYTDQEVKLLTEFLCGYPLGTNIPSTSWEAFAAENPRHSCWSWKSKYYNQRAEFDAVRASAAHNIDNDDDGDGTKIGSTPNARTSFDNSPSRKHPRPDETEENGFRPKRKLFPNSKLNDMVPSTTARKSTPLTTLSSRDSPSTSTTAHKSPTESTARNPTRLEKFSADDIADALNWVIRQPRPDSERDVVLSWMKFAEQRGDGLPPSHWLTIYYTDRKRFQEVEGIAAKR